MQRKNTTCYDKEERKEREDSNLKRYLGRFKNAD